MLKHVKLYRIIIVVVSLTLCIVIFFQFNIKKPGPDSVLYRGLANNIISGVGYIDNIRNSEILPPIGHPFLLAIINLLGINSKVIILVLLVLCFILIFLLIYKLTGSLPLSALGCLLYIFFCPDVFIQDGIEISLFFFGTIWIFALICEFSSKSYKWIIFFAIITVFIILIRPLLLPLVFLSCPILLIFLLIKRYKKTIDKKIVKQLILYFGIVFVLIGSISTFSFYKHGDNRYVSGTYGAISLYCAFNPYIKLERTYYSKIWKKVPIELRKEALEPLKLITTWKDRDQLLKKKVVSFILKNPLKAIKGYLWRVGKYTWMSSDVKQILLFYSSLISISLGLIWIKKYKLGSDYRFHILLSLLLIIYYIGVKALFVYVGSRHHIDTVPILFQPIAILFIILSKIEICKIHGECKKKLISICN